MEKSLYLDTGSVKFDKEGKPIDGTGVTYEWTDEQAAKHFRNKNIKTSFVKLEYVEKENKQSSITIDDYNKIEEDIKNGSLVIDDGVSEEPKEKRKYTKKQK